MLLLQLGGLDQVSQHGISPIAQPHTVAVRQKATHIAMRAPHLRPGDCVQAERCEVRPDRTVGAGPSEELPVCSLGRQITRWLAHIEHGPMDTIENIGHRAGARGCAVDSAPAGDGRASSLCSYWNRGTAEAQKCLLRGLHPLLQATAEHLVSARGEMNSWLRRSLKKTRRAATLCRHCKCEIAKS